MLFNVPALISQFLVGDTLMFASQSLVCTQVESDVQKSFRAD